MKNRKLLFLCSAVLFTITIVFFVAEAPAQRPPETFFKGLDLLKTDKSLAKEAFMLAAKDQPLFHGSHHFLGVIYLADNVPDSAICCFKKALSLNETNTNHTKEMTYLRLMETYLFAQHFNNAFSTAWEAYLQYPLNNQFARRVKDICLWAVYINHGDLDPSYLSPVIKKEYLVNSVPEEYLILRTVRLDDEPLVFTGKSMLSKEGSAYDLLHCKTADTVKADLLFKPNWDFLKTPGGKTINTKKIYSNKKNAVCERMGALLVADPQIDLKIEADKIKVP